MGLFAISFRVARVDTPFGTYNERYGSLVDAIKQHAASRIWEETTSFLLLDSTINTAQGLADSIANMALIDEGEDLLLVINMSRKAYAVKGTNFDDDLDALMRMR